MAKIESKHQWIDELATLSPLINSLNLKKGKDFIYVTHAQGGIIFHDADAYNLSNSGPHNQIIIDSVNALSNRTTDDVLRNLLGEVTFRKTYGAFSELAAYKWLEHPSLNLTHIHRGRSSFGIPVAGSRG